MEEDLMYKNWKHITATWLRSRRFQQQSQVPILVDTDDSNVTPNSPDMCEDDIQNDQSDIQKQLKKENITLAQELKECKAVLAKTSKSLGKSISVQDSCLVALQTKQTKFQKYKAFNDRTVDYDKLKRKSNEAIGQIAHKDTAINEGLKTKAYELSVVKEKHDELMKQSLLTKSHYKGLVKQKTKVITDLKLREKHDIEKMLSMEKQIKFLNEVVYKRSQSIQTIHMMAPKVSTCNGRPTFSNPRYLKQAQSKISCLYAYPYEENTHANRIIPYRKETLALERESRSKLNNDSVRPYDYTKLNSLYKIFKPPTQEYETQLAHANEIRRKMWRKYFVKSKPNIYKKVGFLRISKSISKSRQAYNVMTNNINHFKQIYDDAWTKHLKDLFHAPTALDMEILIQTCLMLLAIKTQGDSLKFVHELKQEMHADLKYVESLKKGIDKLESEKAEFSDMYDVILQDCVSKDVMCSYLQSLSGLDVLEQHSISLEIALQKCKEQVKNDTVCNEKASNGFQKEREQYIKIQDLKAKMQDKNRAISELKKLIEQGKGKFMETKFDRPSVVRQPNAQRIPKPLVLGKSTPFQTLLRDDIFQKQGRFQKLMCQKVYRNQSLHRLYLKQRRKLPQLKSNQSRDKVLLNTSQVKVKKTQVEVHHRIPSVSNKMKSVTTCKDSLNSRTLNVNAVCATCNKCLVDSNHFACVTKMLNDVHARTKKPTVVPISIRKPNSQANKSIATPNKKKIVQLIIFIVDSGCTKHMTGDLKLLCNFLEKILGLFVLEMISLHQFLVVEIWFKEMSRSTVKGLNDNLFSVGQFCDADLEVSFRKSTCFVRDLQGNDLLTGNHGSNLYTISLQESTSSTSLCLMAKATPTQAWLWHRRLSHLNFDYINLLSKKDIVTALPKLKYIKDQLSDADVPSQKELDTLFGPLYDEFFNAGSNPQDKQPSTNIQSTSAPSTHTNVHAEKNNNDQAEEGEHIPDDEFTNPFCTPIQEVAETSSHNIAFLNGPLKEEVYVAQPDGFVDPDHPEKAKYTLEILHKHGMNKGQSIGTPMATKPKLDADLSGNPVDQTNYRSKIGSLMYLISSKPGIVQADSSFELTAFSDAGQAGCIDSRKSTSGGIQFLCDKLVSWMSKK
nr:hypothetical protein [Tanacetum cinerariifolium]